MFETTLPRVIDWLRLWGPAWRLSTWWPSDSRESMQRSLLRLLSVAHSERMETAPLVANLAEEHRGAYRRRLRRFARRLADGTPLVEALEQTPDVLPDESVLAIRFASQVGTLGPTYRYLIGANHAESNRLRTNLRQTVSYGLLTLLISAVMIAFLMIFIVPLLENVHEEFGIDEAGGQAPWAMRTLVAVSLFARDNWPLIVLAAVTAAWLVWSSPSRRYFRRFLATRWVRGAAQTRSAELLRLFSVAVEQGRPLPAALSTLARYHFDENVRRKLMFARIEAEHRGDIWNILFEAGLLTSEESVAMETASSDRSRVWTMRRLADWKLDRIARRSEAMIALLRPIMILVIASIVLLASSALFAFLSQMIRGLA